MDFTAYIRPELAILAPVLMAVGAGLKKSSEKLDSRIFAEDIPLWLLGFGIFLAFLWVMGTTALETRQDYFMAMFTAIVQGALAGWGAVGLHQTIKQKK